MVYAILALAAIAVVVYVIRKSKRGFAPPAIKGSSSAPPKRDQQN